MKRQNRFIVALLAAGITFAALTATIGTEHWKRGYYGHGYWHHYDHHHDNDHDHEHWKSEDPDKSPGEDKTGTEEE